VSGRRQDWPRFSRAEIRSFAAELDHGGWTYEGTDTNGHTIWRHPKAGAQYKLPETPRHFELQRARRDVARLLGQKPAGKRKGKPKPRKPPRDFALQQAVKQSQQRTQQTQQPKRPTQTGSAVSVPTVAPPRRSPSRLPWEGADVDDHYNRGIAQMMRQTPGGRKS
jgi:hypothetical protein